MSFYQNFLTSYHFRTFINNSLSLYIFSIKILQISLKIICIITINKLIHIGKMWCVQLWFTYVLCAQTTSSLGHFQTVHRGVYSFVKRTTMMCTLCTKGPHKSETQEELCEKSNSHVSEYSPLICALVFATDSGHKLGVKACLQPFCLL